MRKLPVGRVTDHRPAGQVWPGSTGSGGAEYSQPMKRVGEIRSQTQWVYEPDASAQLRDVEVGTGGTWIVDGFIRLKGADHRLTDGTVRQSTTEVNRKVLGVRQDYSAAQSGGMVGTSEMVPKVQGKRKGWKVQGIRRSNPNKKNGPDPKEIADPDWARVLDGASLGIPFERLCHLAGMSEKTFAKYLLRHPERKEAIEAAKTRGEYDLTSVVRTCGPGWQGSAWLLERTRGYVARASLEHTGKGGKDLSISGALLGAFGNNK